MARAVIVHLPHASRLVPSTVRDQFVVTDAKLESELARMTDHATDRLFTTDDPRVQPFVFPVSRLVVDPERFEHDADEPMAAIQGRLPLEGRAPESPQCDLCGD
jgi:N-formylglutamate deformylase